jgi:hypothetical protein
VRGQFWGLYFLQQVTKCVLKVSIRVAVCATHGLFALKVQRKLTNGVVGFAAGGSSSDRKRSRPIRAA